MYKGSTVSGAHCDNILDALERKMVQAGMRDECSHDHSEQPLLHFHSRSLIVANFSVNIGVLLSAGLGV